MGIISLEIIYFKKAVTLNKSVYNYIRICRQMSRHFHTVMYFCRQYRRTLIHTALR